MAQHITWSATSATPTNVRPYPHRKAPPPAAFFLLRTIPRLPPRPFPLSFSFRPAQPPFQPCPVSLHRAKRPGSLHSVNHGSELRRIVHRAIIPNLPLSRDPSQCAQAPGPCPVAGPTHRTRIDLFQWIARHIANRAAGRIGILRHSRCSELVRARRHLLAHALTSSWRVVRGPRGTVPSSHRVTLVAERCQLLITQVASVPARQLPVERDQKYRSGSIQKSLHRCPASMRADSRWPKQKSASGYSAVSIPVCLGADQQCKCSSTQTSGPRLLCCHRMTPRCSTPANPSCGSTDAVAPEPFRCADR